MINNRAREISSSNQGEIQAQIDNTLKDLHTAIPAIVVSFDAENRTITAQPTIQRVFSDGAGLAGPQNLPPCLDVPVLFMSAGGYEITYPIVEGDECLLIFSERCIDAWFETGEPSPPDDYRKHDLSDAFAIVGPRSLARKKPVPMDGLHIGSDDNKVIIADDSVTLKKGAAVMALSDSELYCSVPIRCPQVILGADNN